MGQHRQYHLYRSRHSNNATIEFANYSSSTDQSEAFAFYPSLNTSAPGSSGDVFINTYYASTTNDNPGTYEFMTFLHEIGHTLGLEHPGSYNAGPGQTITYQNNAEYIEDTRMYTLMSYFSQTYTGGSYSVYDETPMPDDIAAIQRLYTANNNTRTGNTTYGFNSNAGSPFSITSSSQHVVFTVWDAGGNDTLDFSAYSQNQTIDLRAEHLRRVGGDTYNVCIAQGVTIENAIGGSGTDIFEANSAGDTLTGGTGIDTYGFGIASSWGVAHINDAGLSGNIVFTGVASSSALASRFTGSVSGSDFVLTYVPNSSKVVLQGVSSAPPSTFRYTSADIPTYSNWATIPYTA